METYFRKLADDAIRSIENLTDKIASAQTTAKNGEMQIEDFESNNDLSDDVVSFLDDLSDLFYCIRREFD